MTKTRTTTYMFLRPERARGQKKGGNRRRKKDAVNSTQQNRSETTTTAITNEIENY